MQIIAKNSKIIVFLFLSNDSGTVRASNGTPPGTHGKNGPDRKNRIVPPPDSPGSGYHAEAGRQVPVSGNGNTLSALYPNMF